jgi:hypothetical protein
MPVAFARTLVAARQRDGEAAAEYARMGKADYFDNLSLLLDSDPPDNMGNAQLSCRRRW